METDVYRHIHQHLIDSWGALGALEDTCLHALTPDQRAKVMQAMVLVAEVLIEIEDTHGHHLPG